MLLAAIVPLLPRDGLHIIPSLVPEAVLATKEANEKTREAAYDLVVALGRKMEEGGTIKRALVAGMEDEMAEDGMFDPSTSCLGSSLLTDWDASTAEASIEEYFTVVAAGLAGSSPHMISATITALSRLLFEFNSMFLVVLLETTRH
jgi:ribosomal RNA-processing protein 12